MRIKAQLILDNIFSLYKPDCVYHAAAYKHVTIVEENIIDGINNNVFGTINLTELAINHYVEKFV
jgi:FlaA1/EpsC-like NDP-sugar epimerase